MCLLRGVSCLQELDLVQPVLDACPIPFAIELAALLASRKQLSLDGWLQDSTARRGQPFAQVRLACSTHGALHAGPVLSESLGTLHACQTMRMRLK